MTELESNVLNEMPKRIIQDFLDVVILLQLRKRPLNGYDIVWFVHDKYDILLSSGTVYSSMYALERKGLIKGEHASKTRIYTLTERGKETTRAFINAKDKILKIVLDIFVA